MQVHQLEQQLQVAADKAARQETQQQALLQGSVSKAEHKKLLSEAAAAAATAVSQQAQAEHTAEVREEGGREVANGCRA